MKRMLFALALVLALALPTGAMAMDWSPPEGYILSGQSNWGCTAKVEDYKWSYIHADGSAFIVYGVQKDEGVVGPPLIVIFWDAGDNFVWAKVDTKDGVKEFKSLEDLTAYAPRPCDAIMLFLDSTGPKVMEKGGDKS